MKPAGVSFDLATTPAARKFRDELRGWLAEHLTERFREPSLRDPTGASGEEFERRRAWQRVLSSGGWAGVHWPGEFGGRDATLREYAIYLLECAQAGAPEPVNVIGLGMVGPTLIAHGSPAQRRYLAGILSADEIWCQLFSEPDAGSDLGAISTRATALPDGGWSVTGQKVWTSWGLHADRGLLLARTGRPGFDGLSCFLVPMTADGITVRGIRQISGDTHFTEVFLEDVHLPPEALVGELDKGWSVATGTLTHERTTAILSRHATTAVAAAKLLELTEQDGVAAALRQDCLRVWSEAQLFLLNGYRGVIEAEGNRDKTSTVAFTQRLQWGLLNRRIFELALSVHNAAGMLASAPEDPELARWSHLFTASRGWTIGGGTSEIQRNMLAERVLRLPRSPK